MRASPIGSIRIGARASEALRPGLEDITAATLLKEEHSFIRRPAGDRAALSQPPLLLEDDAEPSIRTTSMSCDAQSRRLR